jgi:hypothetical protein
MTDSRPLDTVAGGLLALGIVGSLVELFYVPFAVAPPSLLVVLAALIMSTKHRRLGFSAAFMIMLCFVIGAAIAVWYSRSLY